MTFAEFEQSLKTRAPPHGLAPALAALWWAKKGDWDKAHQIIMDQGGRSAAWVHAHRHRSEGDSGIAAYWYRQARKPVATSPLDEEWDEIVAALIGAEG